MKTYNELEPVKDDDEELENKIRQLIARKDAARDGSAEHRMIIRQLNGLRGSSQWPSRSWKNTTTGLAIPELIGPDAQRQPDSVFLRKNVGIFRLPAALYDLSRT
jgi:hypothetical protein